MMKHESNDGNDDLIDKWTSAYLKEFERPRTCVSRMPINTQVVFGRTTRSPIADDGSARTICHQTRAHFGLKSFTLEKASLLIGTKLSNSRAMEVLKQRQSILAPATGQESKFRGQQLHNFKIDLSKAREKRTRQIQYSREVASGAQSQKRREIDSITRLVVQGFRKLIDCERCALFLMDETSNELYFKPVGDRNESHARLKEIRFPASSGVAGWVARNKMMCNITNAYHDDRFNPDIDKVTGFRTRTILCYPVLSSSSELLGVIQMVNKKKGDAKELREMAKKKKSDGQNKGYQSCFEHFSRSDEEILANCCNEVSKSLEEIFSSRLKLHALSLDDDNASSVRNKTVSNLQQRRIVDESSQDEVSHEQSSGSGNASYRKPVDNFRRRSSSGSLAQFVRRSSIDHAPPLLCGTLEKGITEAVRDFRFRSPILPESILKSEIKRRQNDPQFKNAETKRNRMIQYHVKTRNNEKERGK